MVRTGRLQGAEFVARVCMTLRLVWSRRARVEETELNMADIREPIIIAVPFQWWNICFINIISCFVETRLGGVNVKGGPGLLLLPLSQQQAGKVGEEGPLQWHSTDAWELPMCGSSPTQTKLRGGAKVKASATPPLSHSPNSPPAPPMLR